MDQASMVLRKWTTNSDELRQLWKREGLENQLQDNPISPRVNSTKVLGMLWNTVEDHLIVGTQSLVDSLSNNENTKRHLLRAIGKIFDSLGLLSPFTIRVKCILQVLWMKEISWDCPQIFKKRGVNGFPRFLIFPNYISLDMCSVLLRENPLMSWNFTVFVMPAKRLMVLLYIQEL
ncbi:hypothetical protein AVEN_229871-1 [Araneus ventricosus]|uniref:Uncharacterized protein n=1 Tax=Araneus ventricosus TaxID=182803 RepID=A0A4Y2RAR3_ARAVE|nr:hypothetical protein AVEN_232941-1 [Araneus ventricosus]GBN71009.1 hypothetical protein AVEN_212654-1 [Araneus ventricosus]GBN72500.1 hypothetical protein AVEN_180762-1 [Araneus ventricosus]GBN72511.1 hypothetical protein AVEN_229871-1 [Araneus ventricosus]